MVDNLLKAFERATEKYLDMISSSDDEIAVEYMEPEKRNGSKLEEHSSSNSKSRRKPMLAAQTDKKRERSVSETSETSRNSYEFNEIDTVTYKNEKNLKKTKKSLKSKSTKLNKKQRKVAEIDNFENELKGQHGFKKTKKEKILQKKSTETGKTKAKKSTKKNKKKSPKRSRSSSQSLFGSPPRSDLSNSPISWSPSSPEEKINFSSHEIRKRSQESNDSEDSFKGKLKFSL